MTVKNFKDNELESILKSKSAEERKLTLEIIELLEEMDRRKLFLARGYCSLLEYCVKELKYSESSAYRRIAAMRVVREVPEAKQAIESGALNLVTVAQAQTFFRGEEKINKPFTREEKSALLSQLQNKSSREAERMFLQISPEAVPQERVRLLTPEKTQVTLVLDESLMQKLNHLKDLLSHQKPNCNYAELIEILADLALKKLDLTAQRDTAPAVAPPRENLSAINKQRLPTRRTRHIPKSVKRAVWKKSKGQCCYSDPKTGKTCGAKRFLEIDHIKAFSEGGQNTIENLQLLCDAHNRWKYDSKIV